MPSRWSVDKQPSRRSSGPVIASSALDRELPSLARFKARTEVRAREAFVAQWLRRLESPGRRAGRHEH
jgi:hypothetical protein